MSQLPLQLLPPLAIDGNLHSAYTIFANAHELAEPEDVAFFNLRAFHASISAGVYLWR